MEKDKRPDKRKDFTDGPSEVHHQVVYGNSIRVVETQVPYSSQESFEVVPEWPPGQPVPHYNNEGPPRSPLRRFMNLLQRSDQHSQKALAEEADPLIPNFIKILAREKQDFIQTHYNVHFSTYTVKSYQQTVEGPDYKLGPGTLYTIMIMVDTKVQGHFYQCLQIEIFHSSTTGDNHLSYFGLV